MMTTTDITTRSQARRGYRITRLAINVGHSATTGVYTDRIESTYAIAHEGRMVDTVTRKADIALALAVYEGRVCLDGVDVIEGTACPISAYTAHLIDTATLCTYRPHTGRCARSA